MAPLKTFSFRSAFSRWKIGFGEALFFVPTLALAMAFELFGDTFGKRGIPIGLPATLGSIPNFQPKLFPMEIYLMWIGLLTLSRVRQWPRIHFWNRLTVLIVVMLAFCALRAIPDLRENPLLVVRNCAFLWYLALPLMIALYPIPSLRWEGFFQFLYLVSFVYFVLCFVNPVFATSITSVFWFIDLGLMFALAYGLTAAGRWPARLALVSIGFLLGLSYLSSIQRTTIVGLALTLGLLFLSPVVYGKFPRPRWRRIVWLFLGIVSSLVAVGGMRAYQEGGAGSILAKTVDTVKNADPKRRSENNDLGLEQFRYFLWSDAWNEFRSSPVLGIGFLKPVVRRVYAGKGNFYDNSGSFEYVSQGNYSKTTPPLAGPHNSYLNALARMGILGAGMFLLHLACAWLFLTRCYFACFFILLWQMLYAFFNVSLEGPIRSFPILLLVGVGLKLAIENSRFSSESAEAAGAPAKGARRAGGASVKKVGLVHVPYRFVGGEDLHVSVLRDAYRAIGIEPVNIPADDTPPDLLLKAARSLTMGSPAEWDELMRSKSIDFLHINNIHAALGPAFLRWVIARRIPALMTVHNHRFYCTNGLALYGTEVCKACRPKASFLRPIARNCNDSLPKSIYHSAALVEIRSDDLLRRAVTHFLAPSPYIARELQVVGIAPNKMRVFPHPVSVEEAGRIPDLGRVDVAFVGRLSPEKGVMHLLAAAERMAERNFVVVGEGPLEPQIRQRASTMKNLKFLGGVSRSVALAVMKEAAVVCVPSVCHESFSLVAAEALSLGAQLVVPDTQSFSHYAEAPFDAVTAIVANPESLVYSLNMALERRRRTAEETNPIRDRFSLEGFRTRLRQVVSDIL